MLGPGVPIWETGTKTGPAVLAGKTGGDRDESALWKTSMTLREELPFTGGFEVT